MKMKHVVVDGSNIATEGRDLPSLSQLDEAVRAFIDEYSPKIVTVVVDATFPNRIDAKERKIFEEAIAANELITPPAGAIGRGDAFVLQIAKKADAAILSNDSFQEFHGDHAWIFSEGRLIGGKPVPHVGWVFMDRTPVRGPTSRRAVSEAKKVAKKAVKAAAPAETETVASDDEPSPPPKRRAKAKAAEAKAAEAKVDQPPAKASADQPMADDGEAAAARKRGERSTKRADPYNEALPFIEFVAAHPVGSEVDATVERFSSHGAYVRIGEARGYLPLRHMADPAPRSAKEMLEVDQEVRLVVVSIDPPLRDIDLAIPGVVIPTTPAPDEAAGEIAEAITEAVDTTDHEPEVVAAAEEAIASLDADGVAAVVADSRGEAAADETKTSTVAEGKASAPARARGARKAKAPARTPEEIAAARSAAAKKAAATRAAKRVAAAEATATSTDPTADGEAVPAVPAAEAKKVAAKKAPAKKAPAKKAPAKATAKKAPAKKAPAKATAKKAPAKKAPAKKATAETSPVGDAPPVGDSNSEPPIG